MWYNTIPEISAASWLSGVIGLFENTFEAVFAQPVLQLFAMSLLLLVLFSIWYWLIRLGRRGKL